MSTPSTRTYGRENARTCLSQRPANVNKTSPPTCKTSRLRTSTAAGSVSVRRSNQVAIKPSISPANRPLPQPLPPAKDHQGSKPPYINLDVIYLVATYSNISTLLSLRATSRALRALFGNYSHALVPCAIRNTFHPSVSDYFVAWWRKRSWRCRVDGHADLSVDAAQYLVSLKPTWLAAVCITNCDRGQKAFTSALHARLRAGWVAFEALSVIGRGALAADEMAERGREYREAEQRDMGLPPTPSKPKKSTPSVHAVRTARAREAHVLSERREYLDTLSVRTLIDLRFLHCYLAMLSINVVEAGEVRGEFAHGAARPAWNSPRRPPPSFADWVGAYLLQGGGEFFWNLWTAAPKAEPETGLGERSGWQSVKKRALIQTCILAEYRARSASQLLLECESRVALHREVDERLLYQSERGRFCNFYTPLPSQLPQWARGVPFYLGDETMSGGPRRNRPWRLYSLARATSETASAWDYRAISY